MKVQPPFVTFTRYLFSLPNAFFFYTLLSIHAEITK